MRTLSPTATIPVSTLPETQNPEPVPLKISFTEKRKGFVIGRSGHLKLSITDSKVGPVYLENKIILLVGINYFKISHYLPARETFSFRRGNNIFTRQSTARYKCNCITKSRLLQKYTHFIDNFIESCFGPIYCIQFINHHCYL